ncbi:Patatin-like phospholipase [Friedmanniella luteola]|uniref:Patatin-like phospholipase n=1 Tax=Friedmanniella luteola TaxID=546871 RepID=A0A1H1Y1P2_9ACTN|nr:patatin-like phospholipase family protein [Friedmanniella luteola]SDT15340.1 Patatin-like phospholipase [Friedmanniella luteola]
MAVMTGTAALAELRRLLDEGHPDQPFAEAPLPPGHDREQPPGWLWATGPVRPGLRDPAAYTATLHADPVLRPVLHLSPAEALAAVGPGSGSATPAQQAYLRTSIDVTMKGGTTSGVIYPLALCEIARDFRLRNVGGASAGAIAAAFAAAAEVGRATADLRDEPPPPARPAPSAAAAGHVRRGFAGLADVIAWLSQVDDPPGAPDELRTAQLFKPKRAALPLFRLVAAVMRRRSWALPLLAATSFGAGNRAVCLVFLLGLPALLSVGTWLVEGPPAPDPGTAYLVAAGWLLGLTLTVFGLAAALVSRTPPRRVAAPAALREPLPPPPRPPVNRSTALLLGLAAVGLVAVVGLPLASDTWRWLGLARSVLAWLAGALLVLGSVAVSVLGLLGRAKTHRFGLVAGSSTRPDGSADTGYLDGRFARLMGMPRVTVPLNLVDWLDRCLRELAGTSEVLRFGHLWDARYAAAGERPAALAAALDRAGAEPDHRMVNLELMASELVHRVPYRFPLPPGGEQLYVSRGELTGVFPADVVDALTAGPPLRGGRDLDSGALLGDLHPLPAAADLPVVFAVRISLAFPGLFEALHLYRAAAPVAVRDDFGGALRHTGTRLRYPAGPADGPGSTWVQELWFTDGGVTSNFPIHFFDSVLPRWPTVGINLGAHPRGFGHQDVYLPSDQQASHGVPAPMGAGLLGFLAAVVDTARTWRDTAQTFLPASKGRVAWVRQRPDEGGSNLFMPRDRIAALALRGAVAGARLRRRFAADGQWQRHQWLRLRAGLDNLARLHARVEAALRDPQYAQFTRGREAGRAAVSRMVGALAEQADPTPAGPDPYRPPADPPASAEVDGSDPALAWYLPAVDDGFWPAAGQLLGCYGAPLGDAGTLTAQAPAPAASLRQVPPN